MVSFRSLIAGAALIAAPVMAAATAEQVAASLKSLTNKASALQGPAQAISIVNAPLIIIGQGPFPVCFCSRRCYQRGADRLLATHRRLYRHRLDCD